MIKKYVKDFFKRSGSFIFVSTVSARLLSFLGSWIALQMIAEGVLGELLFAFHIISFLMPLSGLGLPNSLVRYGALASDDAARNALARYVLKYGFRTSVLLSGVCVLAAWCIPFPFPNARWYFMAFSMSFPCFFFMDAVKSYYRIFLKNKTFAYFEIIYYSFQVSLIFVCSLLWEAPGYTAALIISPMIVGLLFFFKLSPLKIYEENGEADIEKKSFWKYAILSGITGIATQFLFALDILMIGWMLQNPSWVTIYKYLIIIPFSMQFLSRIFMITDFVAFTQKMEDKSYIINYIKGYMQLFFWICLFFGAAAFLLSAQILSIFGDSFKIYVTEFRILCFGVCGILLLRGLFGHLLSSINKIQVNYLIILTALIINVISNYFLIPKFGIKGAAITSAAMMWFTGLLSAVAFMFIYRNKKFPSGQQL